MFKEDAIAPLIGKTVVVRITEVNGSGSVLGHHDYRGRIIRANPEEGVAIQTPSGSVRRFPLDLRAIYVARRGRYVLSTTGEVVWDPDQSQSRLGGTERRRHPSRRAHLAHPGGGLTP